MSYSKIRSVHVTNFMSIRKGSITFDDSGIVTIVGYNNSGKSALLRAMDIALNYSYPRDQKKFIHDGARYFQVDIDFSDDVTLRYEKHESGSSLYELYQSGDLIFTNKLRDGLYEKIEDVPAQVKKYLGMVTTPQGVSLNYGVNTDPQLLVETSGSENYSALSSVLKSGELAKAVKVLNTEANDLQAQINEVYGTVQALQNEEVRLTGVTESFHKAMTTYAEMVNGLSSQTDLLESAEAKAEGIAKMSLTIPELDLVDTDEYSKLRKALSTFQDVTSEDIAPEVSIINTEAFEALRKASNLYSTVTDSTGAPEVPMLSDSADRYMGIANGYSVWKDFVESYKELAEIETELDLLSHELTGALTDLRESGHEVTQCPNCNEVFFAEEHSHVG